jgi:hypothetical protein
MNKTLKIIIIFLAFDALALGAYFGLRALNAGRGRAPQDEYEWTTVDEAYQPRDAIETFIKEDAQAKSGLPLRMRNFGRNDAVLRRFKGSSFARPKGTVLEMTYPGLEDWKLVDLWYAAAEGREVKRTVLYVMLKGAWKVADSGQLLR